GLALLVDAGVDQRDLAPAEVDHAEVDEAVLDHAHHAVEFDAVLDRRRADEGRADQRRGDADEDQEDDGDDLETTLHTGLHDGRGGYPTRPGARPGSCRGGAVPHPYPRRTGRQERTHLRRPEALCARRAGGARALLSPSFRRKAPMPALLRLVCAAAVVSV